VSNRQSNSIFKPRSGLLPEDYSIDRETGFLVFTAAYHKKRGYCCKSGCRHCPYGLLKEGEG